MNLSEEQIDFAAEDFDPDEYSDGDLLRLVKRITSSKPGIRARKNLITLLREKHHEYRKLIPSIWTFYWTGSEDGTNVELYSTRKKALKRLTSLLLSLEWYTKDELKAEIAKQKNKGRNLYFNIHGEEWYLEKKYVA